MVQFFVCLTFGSLDADRMGSELWLLAWLYYKSDYWIDIGPCLKNSSFGKNTFIPPIDLGEKIHLICIARIYAIKMRKSKLSKNSTFSVSEWNISKGNRQTQNKSTNQNSEMPSIYIIKNVFVTPKNSLHLRGAETPAR